MSLQHAFAGGRPIAGWSNGRSAQHGTNLVPAFVVMLQDPAIGQREVGALWYAPCNPPYAPG